jgi:hypothetical protein
MAGQFHGFVSEVRLISPGVTTPYGSHGHLHVELTTLPHGQGGPVVGVALYHLTRGATVEGAVADHLLTENQSLTLLLAYSAAVSNGTRVRINTNNFAGGLQIQDVAFTSK